MKRKLERSFEKSGAVIWVAGLILLAALVASPSSGFGRDGPGHHDRHGMRESGGDPSIEMISRHAKKLGLSDEALAAIRATIEKSRARGETLRFELDEAHRRLTFMLSRDEPIEAEVMEQADKIGRIRIEESKHRLGTLLEIRAHLTPEQREKLRAMREKSLAHAWEKGAMADLARACGGDVEELCPDTDRGHDRMRCMREHRDEMSEGCREALEKVRRDGHRERDGSHGKP